MKFRNRNGVLGLDTAKEVMITFLILAVVGLAVILALNSFSDSVVPMIDNTNVNLAVTNETGAYVNSSGYLLNGYNSSWSSITGDAVWVNVSGTPYLIPSANYTISNTGVLTNSTLVPNATEYNDAQVTYNYIYTYSTNMASSIIENVSSGIVIFFGSTGTIFSILIVVVIILAISIIIWAVGRFGNNANESVNL